VCERELIEGVFFRIRKESKSGRLRCKPLEGGD